MLAGEQSEKTAKLIPTLRRECRECSTVMPNSTLALPRVMTHEAAPEMLQSGTPETLGVQSLPVTLREAAQEILAPTITSSAFVTSEMLKVTEVKVPTATANPKSIPGWQRRRAWYYQWMWQRRPTRKWRIVHGQTQEATTDTHQDGSVSGATDCAPWQR